MTSILLLLYSIERFEKCCIRWWKLWWTRWCKIWMPMILWRLYERVPVEAGGEAPQGPGWPWPRLAPHQAEAAAQPPHRGGRPQLLRHQPRPFRVLVLLQQRRRAPVVYVQNHDWRLRVRERCILLYMIVGGLGVESVLFREFSRLNLDTRM